VYIENEDDQNELLELTEGMEAGHEGEEHQFDQQDDADEYTLEVEGEEADDDEVAIDALPEEQRSLPKKLRERLQTEQREKFELQKRIEALEQGNKPKPVEVGEKPTLESCDWDADKFEADLSAWHERKRAADGAENEQKRAAEAQQAEYQKDLNNYIAKKAALPIAQEKKDAAEKLMIDTLPQILQSALIKYTDDPAKVAVALAAAPHKLAAIANEKDPIMAIIKMREMEGKIKMVNKRKAPMPESATIVRGSAPVSGNSKKTLEKLEEEARSSGDRTKLIAFKMSQQKKDKAA
jgi:hypothetical protein